jgi:predicted CXXCH cytochrome family protein
VSLAIGFLLIGGTACRKTKQGGRTTSSPEGISPGKGAAETKLPAHGPQRKCEICHGEQDENQIASAEVKLVAEPPQLCFKCHPETDYSDSTETVHGPLAVGACLFCHDPHLSKNKHLLRKPVPELCYGCHDKNAIDLIADHSGADACLSCHKGHSSPKKSLLRVNPAEAS